MDSEKLFKEVLERVSKLSTSSPQTYLDGIDLIEEYIKVHTNAHIDKLIEHYDDRLSALVTKKKRVKDNYPQHIEEIRNEIEQLSNHLHDYLDIDGMPSQALPINNNQKPVVCPKCCNQFLVTL